MISPQKIKVWSVKVYFDLTVNDNATNHPTN